MERNDFHLNIIKPLQKGVATVMKPIFEEASIEFIEFLGTDIITTSPPIGDNDGEIDWEG